MYEQQRDNLMQQSFNMEQLSFAQESMKDTVVTVAAMKDANKALGKQMKQISINDVEDMQDDLADMLDDHQAIQEAMSRSYGMEDVDEADLDAELEAMGAMDALDMDESSLNALPSYLATPAVPATPAGALPATPGTAVDEYGLPLVPARASAS